MGGQGLGASMSRAAAGAGVAEVEGALVLRAGVGGALELGVGVAEAGVVFADRGGGADGLVGEVGGLLEVAAVEGDVAEGGEGGGLARGAGEGLAEEFGGLVVVAAAAGVLGLLDEGGGVEGGAARGGSGCGFGRRRS
jgi:hypothetical protein